MKAFRGTLIAAILLAVAAIVAYFVLPEDDMALVVEEPPLFRFEKPELIRVEIVRSEDTLVLAEQPDGDWLVEGPQWPANRSMVNRVKHQIHDLTGRADVIENPEAPELYGLGQNAIKVELTLRDGRKVDFLAGDPNPSNVSYYIQPLPGDQVFTVKKSALDYYSMQPVDFRERKFATPFDSNDADRIEAELPGGRRLVLQRENLYQWRMEVPLKYRASREEVRRLLGRVAALKARDFVEDHPKDLAVYGLDRPRARIQVKFASRSPVDLLIGGAAPPDEESIGEPHSYSYMTLSDGFTVYTARDDLLEDFLIDPEDLRLKKFMRMRVGEITDAIVTLRTSEDSDLEGQVTFMYRADKWLWEDGTPVPGSTPSRVAHRASEIAADAIIADTASNRARWGFDNPLLSVQLTDLNGVTRTLIVGDQTEPDLDPEGRERPRYLATTDEGDFVYRIDEGVVDVAEDAIREWNRKSGRDDDKAVRHRRMEDVMGTLPEPLAAPVPSPMSSGKSNPPSQPPMDDDDGKEAVPSEEL